MKWLRSIRIRSPVMRRAICRPSSRITRCTSVSSTLSAVDWIVRISPRNEISHVQPTPVVHDLDKAGAAITGGGRFNPSRSLPTPERRRRARRYGRHCDACPDARLATREPSLDRDARRLYRGELIRFVGIAANRAKTCGHARRSAPDPTRLHASQLGSGGGLARSLSLALHLDGCKCEP